MPSPMPIDTISPVNRLFGSATINAAGNGFDPSRLPSTYYMNAAGEFVRLRALHSSGFAIFRKAARVVGIYTGAWDRNQSFNWNATSNGQIVFRELGDNAADISDEITNLQGTTMTTAQILAHNANPSGNLDDEVVFVDDGALAGSYFGGDQHITNNLYEPMHVVDATNNASTRAHRGHTLITPETAQGFYDTYYPGLLTQLMQLGQSAQSISIDLSPKGRSQVMEIMTNVEYFPRDMFASQADQTRLTKAMIMSFV